MKCPICKLRLEESSLYDSDVHQVVESVEICTNGCKNYSFEFSYGCSKVEIGKTVLVFSYNVSKTQYKKIGFIAKKAIRRERKKWLKLTKGLQIVPLEKCLWCNGSGAEYSHPCTDCFGTGYIYQNEAIYFHDKLQSRIESNIFYD